MKNLIIVESPTKAKTIKNFVSKDFDIIASKGHIRDLPKTSFGIKIENGNFAPEYRIQKDHSQIVKELKAKVKNAQTVFIATDEDREGEAIGYHIAVAIGKEPETLPRIVFHEITKNAILKSLENPRHIDIKSFNAQQARRLLDRIVGYKLSPLLSQKIQKGLSAGRVQSSALKIVVDREREIKAFKPEEFWSIDAIFNKEIDAILVEFQGEKIEKFTINNEKRALQVKTSLQNDNFFVKEIETKQRKSPTMPPFMTSTLQQSASSLLGFSPKKTMLIAQKLYEGVNTDDGVSGVITYMRTDSLNISKEAIKDAREYIKSNFDKKYLPAKSKIYKSKSKSAQEAHEAIRPTNINFDIQKASNFLQNDEYKLYKLIYARFLASQMSDAIFESTNILIQGENGIFKASGTTLVFDGFYKVMQRNAKDKFLPKLNEKEKLSLDKLEANQHFTEPPARYSEASLIKKLESLGIGRPSTYAPTISILTSRDYINIEKKQLIPQEISFKVISLLEEHFSQIVDSNFTSKLEEKLDSIADGKEDWQEILQSFYEPFMKQIDNGKKNIKSQKIAIPTGETCPECGKELVKRAGRFGEFIACSGFPKCKYSKNLGKSTKKEVVKLNVPCPKCGGDIVERVSKRGKFYGCSNYPKCKFVSSYELIEEKCKACGDNLVKKVTKKGEIIECNSCEGKK